MPPLGGQVRFLNGVLEHPLRGGQPLLELTRRTHEETQAINQDDQRYKYKIERAGHNSGDGHSFTAIFTGIVLDLKPTLLCTVGCG